MGIREIINEQFPVLIPELTYVNEIGETQNRIYYAFVPEDEEHTPAMAYIIESENEMRDLEGNVYAAFAVVRFGILSNSLETLDIVKNKMLNLCGCRKVRGVQLITYMDGGDADADLTLQHNLTGVEIALKFNF